MLFRETDRVQRTKASLCMVLFDIDDFGHWNSRLGSDACDELLCKVVSRTTRLLRSYDLFGRPGKDEFLVALPGCSTSAPSCSPSASATTSSNSPFRVSGQIHPPLRLFWHRRQPTAAPRSSPPRSRASPPHSQSPPAPKPSTASTALTSPSPPRNLLLPLHRRRTPGLVAQNTSLTTPKWAPQVPGPRRQVSPWGGDLDLETWDTSTLHRSVILSEGRRGDRSRNLRLFYSPQKWCPGRCRLLGTWKSSTRHRSVILSEA